jgi:hypothetical protein
MSAFRNSISMRRRAGVGPVADRFMSPNRSLRIEDFLTIAAVTRVKLDVAGGPLPGTEKRALTCVALCPIPAWSLRRGPFRERPSTPTDRVRGRVNSERTGDVTFLPPEITGAGLHAHSISPSRAVMMSPTK